jgi:hypothetical protein
VLFAAKAWTLMLIITAPRQPHVTLFSSTGWLGLALASLALSLVWVRLPIVPSVELVVGHSLCGATVAVALLRLWRGQRTPTLRLQ